jgi:hypothetical protein
LSRRCGSLNLSHPYRPSRPVTGIALLTFTLLFYVVVAKVREKLAVSKQTMHKFCMERSNLKKLNEPEDKKTASG